MRIPEEYVDLLKRPVMGHLATIMADGSPQVTPVWVDYDGEYVLVNTTEGRLKTDNMRRNPQVALDMVDPDDQFRYLAIRGRVVEITTEGGLEHADELGMRYINKPIPWRGTERLIVKIVPERVKTHSL